MCVEAPWLSGVPPLLRTHVLVCAADLSVMPGELLSAEEIRLAKMWYDEDDMAPADIAKLLRRDKSTITRLLVKKVERKSRGQPKALSDTEIDRLVKVLTRLVVKADGEYEVTAEMLRRAARVDISTRTILNALHSRKIYFRRLREKPLLTPEDVKARLAFAKKYKGKSAKWWNSFIDMHIDAKFFKVYLHGKARAHAAREGTRGAYRTAGQGLGAPYVKRGKRNRYNPGANSVMVLAGIGHGRVLLWKVIDGRRWNGDVASEMYLGPVKAALVKACPRKRRWRVLEDNDPAGFQSRKGRDAKRAAKIVPFHIPRRSPGLNVCDYMLWNEINTRMRRAEAKWHKGRRETRAQYIARLRRTAMRLPRKLIQKSIGDMRRRCARLFDARGNHFEEGGR